MLTEYEKRVTIAGRVCVASALTVALLISLATIAPDVWSIHPLLWLPVGLSVSCSFWYACWGTAKAKGYSGWVGAALPAVLSIVGVIILILLRDKTDGEASDPTEMSPPKSTISTPQVRVPMRNIATLLNISLLITVAYLMVKFGPPHAGNAWIFTLMVLAPLASLWVIRHGTAQDWLSLFLQRKALEEQKKVDELKKGH
ncbi:MAG: hypothetical protein V5B44_17850 [Candidatus Accumulibacter necessarius]|uniref:hypothetical protein n=1 Tax=Candidatus Accumulibacter necessarius TaxID=2954386 RepID=UPI002FC2B17E